MAIQETLNLKITFDEKGAVKAVKSVEKTTKKASKTMQKETKSQTKTLDKLRGGYVLLAGVITGIVGAAFKKVINLAKDFEESNAKFGVVFKNNSKAANAMRKELVNAYGLSTLAATEMLASIQDFLVPMGIARKEATGLSGNFVKLARDLGSFNNQPTEEVMNAIKSALSGMSIPMKRFGVDVTQTGLQQQLLNEGINKSVTELTRAQKAQLIYRKIVNDSSDAIGDYKRTSNSYANTLVEINAITEDVGLTIGQQVLKQTAPLIRDFRTFIKSEKGVLLVSGAVKVVVSALIILKNTIRLVSAPFRGLFNVATESIKGVAGTLKSVFAGNFKKAGKNAIETGKNIAKSYKEGYGEMKDAAAQTLKDMKHIFTTFETARLEGTNKVFNDEKEKNKQRIEDLMLTQEEMKALQDSMKVIQEEEKAAEKEKNIQELEEERALFAQHWQIMGATEEQMLKHLDNLESQITEKRIERFNKVAENVKKNADNMTTVFGNLIDFQIEGIKRKEKADGSADKAGRKRLKAFWFANKASQVTSIISSTASAVMAALAPPPLGLGPVAGLPLSVTTGLAGATQLAKVLMQKAPKFALGGTVSGRGGVDSQLVAATPGETMINPRQGKNLFNALEASGLLSSRGGQTISNNTITNNNDRGARYIFNAPISVMGDKSFEREVNTRLSQGGDFV